MSDQIESAMWKAGYDAVARALKIILKDYLELWAKKQNDYGAENIAVTREQGLTTRSIDKTMRLKRHYIDGIEMQAESIDNAWVDLAGHGLIGMVFSRGQWPKMELEDILKDAHKKMVLGIAQKYGWQVTIDGGADE
tara:strand:- start:533 stop:943 length:411 start_codon:yes stop_codon:yes gene_type:complete